jgi:hypothetical protein
MKPLFKTTIIVWSEPPNNGEDLELDQLAYEAMNGWAYCSKQSSELISDPAVDPDWDGTEFFNEDS